MKNKIYILFFLLLVFCINLYSQGNFQNPMPQGNPLFHIKALNSQNAFAVGTVGTRVRTTDGGRSWTPNHKSGGSDQWLWATHLFSANSGYAVGGGGNIFRIEGEQWTRLFSGTDYTLQSIFFLNNDRRIGWVAGWYGTILKTTDYGVTWTYQISGTTAHLYSINFINADTGFCVGIRGVGEEGTVGEVLKTTNGGTTWQTLRLGYDNRLQGVTFRDGVGWIYGWGGLMLKSTDYGTTWVPKNRLMNNSIYSIDFPTENIGYAAGETGILLKTTNTGETWFELNSPTEDTIYSISFVDERTGWFVGENGLIFKTTDGGQNWEEPIERRGNTTKWLTAVDFVGQTGWAVGEKGTILKTVNNGGNWDTIPSENINTTSQLNAVQFPTSDTIGYTVGEGGTILKSTNGGTDWSDIAPIGLTRRNFTDLHFTSDYIGFVAAGENLLLKTTNGGINWSELRVGVGNSCSKVFFWNSDIGWVIGSAGRIYKTTDGGNSWVQQNSPTSRTLLYIKFTNENFGWITGTDGVLLKTTNGGNSWQLITTTGGFGDEISRIFVSDSLHLWAVGKWGTLLKSTNGGTNWSRIQTITSNFLSTLYFTDITNGFLFGKGGTILNYQEGIQRPIIGITKSAGILEFSTFQGGPLPSDSIVIYNAAGGTLRWDVPTKPDWLDINPSYGTNTNNSTLVALKVNRTTNLATDTTHTGSIVIRDTNAINNPQTIDVRYHLFAPGKQPVIDIELEGGDTVLHFEAKRGDPLPANKSFTIRNSGGNVLNWEAKFEESPKKPWIDPPIFTSGTLREGDSIVDSIGVNTTEELLIDTAYLEISSPVAANPRQRIKITYEIYSGPMFVVPDTITFLATQNGGVTIPDTHYVVIGNTGKDSYTWSGEKNADWFDFDPDNGRALDTIKIWIDSTTDFSVDRAGSITLRSPPPGAENSPATITVILKIIPEVVFMATEIGESRDTTLTIPNTGTNINSFKFYGEDSLSFNAIPIGNQGRFTFTFSPKKIGRKTAEFSNGITTVYFIGFAKDTRPPDITVDPILNPILKVINDSGVTYGNEGNDIEVTATARDFSGIRNFDLWYRNSGQDWKKLPMIKSNQRWDDSMELIDGTQYIPASIFTEKGVDYRITAEDSAGIIMKLLPPGHIPPDYGIIAEDSTGNIGSLKNMNNENKPITFFSISVGLNNKNLIGSAFLTPAATGRTDEIIQKYYRMFSAPIIFDPIQAKAFWGYLGEYMYQWRFRVPPIDNKLGDWRDGENEVIQSGVSYFIITRSNSRVFGHTGKTVKFEDMYRDGVQLQEGYNYIGNPFTFEVPSDKIVFIDRDTRDTIKEGIKLWYYPGNGKDLWSLYEPFKVWSGYCIDVFEPTQMLIKEVITDTDNSLKKESKTNDDGWEVQITATDGELFDIATYAGMKSLSSDNFDKYDFRKPPLPFEGGLSVIFPHKDWGNKSGNYAGDYKALNNSGAIWDIKITSDKDKTISLEFIKSISFPNNFSIKLFDTDYLKYSTIVDNKISFGSSGEKNFKLIIGTEDFFKEEDPRFGNITPKSFSLFQNYPNPFNSKTNIFYHLPKDGKVVLEIYSVLGSRVKTIVNQFQLAGTHEISFDAKDLASGIYFYKISVNGSENFRAVKKMLLLK